MIRAARAGIPCLPYTLVSKYERNMGLPALCFAVNPYTCNSVTQVKSESKMLRTMKSLSMNNRYPVSIQPLMGDVIEAVQAFGETDVPEAKAIAGSSTTSSEYRSVSSSFRSLTAKPGCPTLSRR